MRLLVELLRPAGADLARRWLAALVMTPESERASIVESVENQILQTWPPRPFNPETAERQEPADSS